jgi:hypothetical protein
MCSRAGAHRRGSRSRTRQPACKAVGAASHGEPAAHSAPVECRVFQSEAGFGGQSFNFCSAPGAHSAPVEYYGFRSRVWDSTLKFSGTNIQHFWTSVVCCRPCHFVVLVHMNQGLRSHPGQFVVLVHMNQGLRSQSPLPGLEALPFLQSNAQASYQTLLELSA